MGMVSSLYYRGGKPINKSAAVGVHKPKYVPVRDVHDFDERVVERVMVGLHDDVVPLPETKSSGVAGLGLVNPTQLEDLSEVIKMGDTKVKFCRQGLLFHYEYNFEKHDKDLIVDV